MTFYETLSYYESQPIDVKTYLEGLILSDDNKKNRFAVNFLDEINESKESYPKLYDKLKNSLYLIKQNKIDKEEFIRFAIEDKIIRGWDRNNSGFFDFDLPKQLRKYKENYPEICNEVLYKIFTDSTLYSIALNNMKSTIIQFLPDELKITGYENYCEHLLKKQIDLTRLFISDKSKEMIEDGTRIINNILNTVFKNESDEIKFNTLKQFWKNNSIKLLMSNIDIEIFTKVDEDYKVKCYTTHMLNIVNFETNGKNIDTIDKINKKEKVINSINTKFISIYYQLTNIESIETQQKIYDFLGTQDIIEYTFKVINKKIIQKYEQDNLLFTNNEKMFYQKTNIEHNLGIQGWRIHIIADTNIFYHKILTAVFNEYFNKNISEFKVLNPELLISVNDLKENPDLMKKLECGREFTIYISQNINFKFSKDFTDLFYFKSRKKMKNDMNVGGLMNINYGFFSGSFKKLKHGKLYLRNNILNPQTLNDIFNLRMNIVNKYYETQDYKRYLQDMLIYNITENDKEYVFSDRFFDSKYLNDIYNTYSLMVKQNPEKAFTFEIFNLDGYYFIVSDIADDSKLQNFQDYYNAKGYIIQDYNIGTQSLQYPREYVLSKQEDGSVGILTQDMLDSNYGMQAEQNTKKGFFKKNK